MNQEQLIVGKYYHVSCAEIKSGYTHSVIAYVPVYGEKHKDPQFGVDYLHYHIDGRFVGQRGYITVDTLGRTNAILKAVYDSEPYTYVSRIVTRVRKCRRLTTGIIPPEPPNKPGVISKYHNWYTTMIGKSCKGKKCPHLGTVMHEVNGLLVCPLHNLIGCPKQEIIIDLSTLKNN